MFTWRIGTLGVLVLLATAVMAACGAPSGPSIKVDDVWARPAMAMAETEQAAGEGMGMAGTGAVFMHVVNEGKEADRLVGGETDVAKAVEIHETVMQGEVMKMQMLPDGLLIPARGEVQLKPGSYHVMLIGMQRDLAPGDTFTLELHFEKTGTITVEPEVKEP
jgi:copper(I)-binding protein